MLPNGPIFEKLLSGGYRASLGNFSAHGATKGQAQSNLFANIAGIPSNVEPVVVRDERGAIWYSWFDLGNWAYRLPSGSCVIASGDRDRCAKMMLAHMEGYYR